jgi:hypothetical protein
LQLGTEGYSPAILAKATRQASKTASFAEASDDLRELAEVTISSTHLQRISERIGHEWAAWRDDRRDIACRYTSFRSASARR